MTAKRLHNSTARQPWPGFMIIFFLEMFFWLRSYTPAISMRPCADVDVQEMYAHAHYSADAIYRRVIICAPGQTINTLHVIGTIDKLLILHNTCLQCHVDSVTMS